jgi:hypothetical protein
MSNNDTSDDDDDVFLDLLERFPSTDEVLAAVRKHRTVRQFQIFAEKGLSALTCNEIGKALDDDFVPWGKFHEDIIQSVSDAKGKTKSGAARGSVTHMNTKVELKKRFGNCKIEEFDTVDRKDAWRSVLHTFACLYIEELENNVDKVRDDLSIQQCLGQRAIRHYYSTGSEQSSDEHFRRRGHTQYELYLSP